MGKHQHGWLAFHCSVSAHNLGMIGSLGGGTVMKMTVRAVMNNIKMTGDGYG